MSELPVVLVCAPADAPRMVPGTVFCHKCARCGLQVMMAPSGQKRLKREPNTEIICCYCYQLDRRPHACELAAPLEEILAERQGAMPNFWRTRN